MPLGETEEVRLPACVIACGNACNRAGDTDVFPVRLTDDLLRSRDAGGPGTADVKIICAAAARLPDIQGLTGFQKIGSHVATGVRCTG